MPSRYGVSAPGHVLEREAAVLAGDLEIGVTEDGDICLHPWVHVALDGDGNLGTGEGLHNGLSARRLRLVPFPIVFRDGVDVMRGHVGIDDGKRFTRLESKDVRMILTALLVDHYRARLWT